MALAGQIAVGQRPRVAIVDDHPDVADLLCELVTRSIGYEAEAFTSRERFLASLDGRRDFDAVILDLKMPHPSGRIIFERLHAKHFRIPVIVLSATGEALTREATTPGVVVGLQKPAEPHALLSLLEVLVEGKQRATAAR